MDVKFDAGELSYEHVPVLGSFVRILKKKLVQGCEAFGS